MCGISGIIHLNYQAVDLLALKNMSDSQHHRGPDDQGFVGFSFKHNKISPIDFQNNKENKNEFHGGIGFNRLSILDLSLNGHQPMISANGNVVIAYNGETYNAFQFKTELEKKGYSFKSKTDTEILLNLYQNYGIEKLLDLINGMFAFCIVDLELKKVFLARDHVGIKPMYWYKTEKTILFASEIKAFLFHPKFKAEINENNIDEYLVHHYNAHDRTLFNGVFQIPPGHFLEISMQGEKLRKYWEPQLNTTKRYTENEALEKLDSVLKSTVEAQLMSDVKVGCQLSGGIDSSMITTLARQFYNANMDTFSVIPQNKTFSEEKYLNQVIEKTNSLAHKIELTPDYFVNNLFSATWHIDVPIPIPQAIGIKRLAETASDFVTVLLSGEGADELMGGYEQFYNLAFKEKNKLAIFLMSKVPGKGKKIYRQFLPQISNEDYFVRHRVAVSTSDLLTLKPKASVDKIIEQREQLIPNHPDLLKSARVYDIRGWLTNLLNNQDKMTMAHSVENRVPFLDKNLTDLVFSLPSKYFVHANCNPLLYNSPNNNTKILLKKLTARYYNNNFVYRRKVGFHLPLRDYFNHPLMKEMVNDLVLPGIKKRGIWDQKPLIQRWENLNKSNDQADAILLWTCFSFELWAQMFIDRTLKV